MIRQTIILMAGLVAAVLALPATSAAEGDQLYFVGYTAPRGSISAPGAGNRVVYLRWDVAEGSLPDDLASIRLTRDGVAEPLLDVPIDTVMGIAELNGLYAGAEQDRRKREMIETLNGIRKEENLPLVNAGTFAHALHQRLVATVVGDEDARREALMWAHLAARVDFNVAVARHRGFVDTDLAGGTATYRLTGISTAAVEAPLGEVTVDLPTVLHPPAAQDFTQIQPFELSRCDAPEYARAHGVIALSWDHAGADTGARYASALNIVGYDLYRTLAPVDPLLVPTPRNLRLEAAGLPHDEHGVVQFPGLRKVNEDLLTISGRPEPDLLGRRTDQWHKGWNPSFAQIMMPWADVEAEGLAPGDVRAFYLVPRDLSGNYGDTVALAVEVPDLLPPPAPWSVEAIRHSSDNDTLDALHLRWDHINVPNYHKDHQVGRTYCNLDEAVLSQRLTYVPGGPAQCTSRRQVTVNLSVERYIIYRFESETEAQVFTDADGDGRADVAEQFSIGTVSTLPLTRPDQACDPENWPPMATDFRAALVLATDALVVGPDGRLSIEYADLVPATTKGQVYWYRIAAVGRNGGISEMGQPVRGLFPDETKPARPDPKQVPFGECSYFAKQIEALGDGIVAVDFTGDADRVRFVCRPRLNESLATGIDLRQRSGTNYIERADVIMSTNQLLQDSAKITYAPTDETLSDYGYIRENDRNSSSYLAPTRYYERTVGRDLVLRQDLKIGLSTTRLQPGATINTSMLATAQRILVELPLEPMTDNALGATIDAQLCRRLMSYKCEIEAQFLNERGRILATTPVDIPRNEECEFTVALYKDCERGFRPIRPGDVIDGPVVIDLGTPDCVSIFMEVDGNNMRLDTVCGDWPWTWEPPNLGGGTYCLSFSIHNENNQTSTEVELPCFNVVAPGPPEPPSFFGLDFDDTPGEGVMRWTAPEQPTAGVIVEWRRKDGTFRTSSFFGHDGRYGLRNPHEGTIALTPVPGPDEEELWCVRGKSVGQAIQGDTPLISAWSTEMCKIRTPPDQIIPEYLPWPKVPVPDETGPLLDVRYLKPDGRPAVLLGQIPLADLIGSPNSDTCRLVTQQATCTDRTACVSDTGTAFLQCDDFCAKVRAGLGSNVRFVVYRQSRKAATEEPEPFSQITPFINRAFCTRVCLDQLGIVGQAGGNDAMAINQQVSAPIFGDNIPEDACLSMLHDPWIKLLPFSATDDWPDVSLAFVDRFPHIAGYGYRYQFVYFDEQGEIIGHRNTDWFNAPSL